MKQYRRLERQHPIFSPIALTSTLVLLLGLGLGIYFSGGSAFSPGDLSAVTHGTETMNGFTSHAEFSSDCGQCHAPFAGIDASRCEACHTTIAQERQTETALHGRFANAAFCADCHLDHKGEAYDLKTAAVADFDHSLTGFFLSRHTLDYQNEPLACAGCHQQAGSFAVNLNACADCHQQPDNAFIARHTAAYGENCLNCHDGQDTMAAFTLAEHAALFPLTGAHGQTTCEACHKMGEFAGTPQACAACHAEPESHAGLFGTACADCHQTSAFVPAILNGQPFDHKWDTGFSLENHVVNFDERPFTCTTCHPAQQPVTFSQESCATCHQQADPAFMRDHQNQFGADCQSCHDGTGSMANFDHNQVFPLTGQHAAQSCTACHKDQTFGGTPAACAACHAEPAVHANLFGLKCESCHTAEGWLPARLRQHTFPLDHGEQGALECTACHTGRYDQYTCTTCHEHNAEAVQQEHDEVDLAGLDLFDCAACHANGRSDE